MRKDRQKKNSGQSSTADEAATDENADEDAMTAEGESSSRRPGGLTDEEIARRRYEKRARERKRAAERRKAQNKKKRRS